jgi:hypothetical protein
MPTLVSLTPSLRLRTVVLAALFGFTTFFVSSAPTELPVPRPEAWPHNRPRRSPAPTVRASKAI